MDRTYIFTIEDVDVMLVALNHGESAFDSLSQVKRGLGIEPIWPLPEKKAFNTAHATLRRIFTVQGDPRVPVGPHESQPKKNIYPIEVRE